MSRQTTTAAMGEMDRVLTGIVKDMLEQGLDPFDQDKKLPVYNATWWKCSIAYAYYVYYSGYYQPAYTYWP